MAIVSKIERYGVDVVIENLQQKTFPNLLGLWEGGIVYTSYPRANKNYKGDNIIPEVSLDKKDYKEVLNDDKISVGSFFLTNDARTYDEELNQFKQSISIIFQADLVKLYAKSHRADEEFNMDVMRVLKKENVYIVGDIVLSTGVDAVYSDLTLTGDLKNSINLTDISQFHVVKATFDVLYREDCVKTFAPVCGPAFYENSDQSFQQTILSGETFTSDDIIVTINDVDQPPNPSNIDLSFTVPGALNSSSIYKTGHTISFRLGDDGALQRGRGIDHYNLDFTNPWGHSKAYTGRTGGYWDEVATAYKDVDGVVTTEALAFPDGLISNWKAYDPTTDVVFTMDYNFLQTGSNDSMITGAPYTRGGLTGFYVLNISELNSFFYKDIINNWLNYPPLNYLADSTLKRVASSSGTDSLRLEAYIGSSNQNVVFASASNTTFVGKYVTFTELGL